jgi:hypothetical protein
VYGGALNADAPRTKCGEISKNMVYRRFIPLTRSVKTRILVNVKLGSRVRRKKKEQLDFAHYIHQARRSFRGDSQIDELLVPFDGAAETHHYLDGSGEVIRKQHLPT